MIHMGYRSEGRETLPRNLEKYPEPILS